MSADLTLTRTELEKLCETVQPKRMHAWLSDHGWVFEPSNRRGGLPQVDRAYAASCMANGGQPPAPSRTAEEWEAVLPLSGKRGPWLTPARKQDFALRRAETATREAGKEAGLAFVEAQEPAIREAHAALVRFHTAKRRAARMQRTPAWADREAILAVYRAAHEASRRTGQPHHVDHVLPLQGEFVSGLHVAGNLQVLPGAENSRKRNHFEPC